MAQQRRESGPDITWEDGDFFTLRVEVNQSGDHGFNPPKNYDTVDGIIVYKNGSWVTYVARGSSFSKTDPEHHGRVKITGNV